MSNKRGFFYYFGLLGQIGLTICLTIIASVLIYIGYTKLFGENIVVLVLFLAAGIFSGFYYVYKMIFK